MLLFFREISFYLRESVFCLSCLTALIIFILLTVAYLTFQKPVFAGEPKPRSEQHVEIIWAIIPLVILLVMLIPIANVFIHKHFPRTNDEQQY